MSSSFRVVRGVAVCLVLAGTARAQAPDTNRPTRQYTGRIQMHSAPTDVRVPSKDIEKEANLADTLDLDTTPALDFPVIQNNILPYLPTVPARSEKENRSKNWILPPAHDATLDGAKAAKPTEAEKDDPSGWGWLADDLIARQKEESAQTAAEEQEDDTEAFQPYDGGVPKPAMSGLLIDAAPAPTYTAELSTEPDKEPEMMSMISIEELRGNTDNRATSQSEPDRMQARTNPSLKDQTPSFDEKSWGNDSIWQGPQSLDRPNKASPAAILPGSAALLSSLGKNAPPAPSPSAGAFNSTAPGPSELPKPSMFGEGGYSAPPLQAGSVGSLGTPSSSGPAFGSPLVGGGALTPLQPAQPTQPFGAMRPLADPWAK